jgi:hypothetical protein
METIENDFDRYESCLRQALWRIFESTKNGEVASSYDVHDCFVLLNKVVDAHKKELGFIEK